MSSSGGPGGACEGKQGAAGGGDVLISAGETGKDSTDGEGSKLTGADGGR